MALEVLTKEDLFEFREMLLKDFTLLLTQKNEIKKEWLKSTEVRKLLNISPGTLLTLRVNKTLSYTRIGSIIYYASADIEKVMERNKISAEPNLFNHR